MQTSKAVVQSAWSDLDGPNAGRLPGDLGGSPKAEKHWAAAGPPWLGESGLAIDPQIEMEYCNNVRKMIDLFGLWKYCLI